MEPSVRVPALPFIVPNNKDQDLPILTNASFTVAFGNELLMIGIFVLILLALYYVFWQTRSASDTLRRRRLRVHKTFLSRNPETEHHDRNDECNEQHSPRQTRPGPKDI
jgi:ABC-type nickel/cobalt efflux system permease component RcnA